MKVFFKILILLGGLVPSLAQAKLQVVATLPIFGALAQAVGGERVEIRALAKPNQDPHFLDAKPSYVALLSRADLLIQTGMELEVGWLPPVLLQSRNPKIQNSAPGNLDVSQVIHALEVPGGNLDRSEGDVHPQGNPHYFLDPRNGSAIARLIAERLSRLDPEGKSYYDAQLAKFNARLEEKLKSWQGALKSLSGKKVITYHRTLSYFVAWTGLQVMAYIEPKPGIPPNSRHVEELLQLIKQNRVNAILVEEYYPKKIPEFLAQQSGAKMLLVPTNVQEVSSEGFFALFDQLLQNIQGALAP